MTPRELTVLDLFSGIGGFSLGLERAGMKTVAFCESDGYARRVLKKHWPNVWIYEDITTLTAKKLRGDGVGPVGLVCGGFPCQDISCAGKGASLDGARSGLWSEMLRVIKEVSPRWVVAENVPALRSRGADRVLSDLEGAGYSVRPVVVGAWAVGGLHRRDRVWVVADAAGRDAGQPRGRSGARRPGPGRQEERPDLWTQPAGCGRALAYPERLRSRNGEPVPRRRHAQEEPRPVDVTGPARAPAGILADAPGRRHHDGPRGRETVARLRGDVRRWQASVSRVRRTADGVPHRLDRLRCLGNAVVPVIPELIGRWIASVEAGAAARRSPARAAAG